MDCEHFKPVNDKEQFFMKDTLPDLCQLFTPDEFLPKLSPQCTLTEPTASTLVALNITFIGIQLYNSVFYSLVC